MSSAVAFVERFETLKSVFAKEVRRTYERDPELFKEWAEPMLRWAEAALGPDYADRMIDGYCAFVLDVNRSQQMYEESGKYRHSSYAEVHDVTYGSEDFMRLYHWGVFTTTFAWRHHLELGRFYRDRFLRPLADSDSPGRMLDLGCGSGVWHFLALNRLHGWSSTGVDISETSVAAARTMASQVIPDRDTHYVQADAITWEAEAPFDAGVSCFLLEHLEDPQSLLDNLSRCLKPGALAFVTCALTAAEIDHIFEYRRESEPILMAEEAGFRVIETFSSAPERVLPNRRYLPRSMALLLQKRRNETW